MGVCPIKRLALSAMGIACGSGPNRVHAIAEYSPEEAAVFAALCHGNHVEVWRILKEDGEPPPGDSRPEVV